MRSSRVISQTSVICLRAKTLLERSPQRTSSESQHAAESSSSMKSLEVRKRTVGRVCLQPWWGEPETEQECLIYGWKCRKRCSVPPLSFLPSLSPSLWAVYSVWVLLGECPSCLPSPSLAFPPSESSLQEIKGFMRRSRVSYGALWLSGIAGSDWVWFLVSAQQNPLWLFSHFVKKRLSLW